MAGFDAISKLEKQLDAIQSRVDQIAEKFGIQDEPVDLGLLDEELRELVRQGKMVAAVKLARDRTGWSLREAKDYVDALQS